MNANILVPVTGNMQPAPVQVYALPKSITTIEGLKAEFQRLNKDRKGREWDVADCLNQGEDRFGEEMWEATNVFGVKAKTIENWMRVARRVAPDQRRVNELEFAHHSAVVSLTPEQQSAVLELAVVNQWKEDEVQDKVRQLKGLPERSPSAIVGIAADVLDAAMIAGQEVLKMLKLPANKKVPDAVATFESFLDQFHPDNRGGGKK